MKFSKLLAQSILWRGVYFVSVFLVNLLLSRELKASGSGVIFYISNTFAFVQLVAGLSLENGIIYFAAGRQMSPNKLLWLSLIWTAIIIVLQLLVFFLFSFSGTDPHLPFYAFCFITGLLLTTLLLQSFLYRGRLFYTQYHIVHV